MDEGTQDQSQLMEAFGSATLVRALLAVAGDDILIMNQRNTILYCGTGLAVLLGSPSRDIVGRPLRDFLSFDYLDVADPGSSSGGVPLYCTALPSHLRTKDGRCVEIGDLTTPMHDEHGTLIGHVCAIRSLSGDRTTAATTEQPAELYSRIVEESNHRVRNNLATICALLEMEIGCAAETERHYLINSLARTRSLALVYNLIDKRSGMVDVAMLVRAVMDCVRALFPRIDASPDVTSSASAQLSSRRATYLALVLTEFMVHGLRCAQAAQIRCFPIVQVSSNQEKFSVEMRGTCEEEHAPGCTLSPLSREIVIGLVERSLGGQIDIREHPPLHVVVTCPLESVTSHS